ncbi:hypothetical protein Amal_04082 [Acetobacter malorum]|uniref:Uncharacterized protein n=1 Tax=Acetobacter malorum TaxID=178901 RepID=A0A177FU17_9PROT|nr:hypothetical protein Amal_04082 [Acetobacter malorum]
MLPAPCGQFLRPIAPVIQTAQQTHHHTAGLRQCGLQIQIHRHRVTQPRQTGDLKRGGCALQPLLRVEQAEQVALRKGENHQIRWRQAEVFGLILLIKRPVFPDKEVHKGGPAFSV